MKTFREWILDEHRVVEPRLNRLQDEVLSATPVVGTPLRGVREQTALLSFPAKAWRELIWPSRHTWAALAAVWVVIAVANVASRNPAELTRPAMATVTPDALSIWQLQQHMLADLSLPPQAKAQSSESKLPSPGKRGAMDWLAREHEAWT